MSRSSATRDDSIFSVERLEADGVRHLHLNGVIDEFSDLSFLHHLRGRVVVHLAGVRRINSFGVRLWMDGVRAVPEDVDVTYVEVAVPLVEQMNRVRGFFGRGRVESFVAPLACEACGATTARVFTRQECSAEDPPGLPAAVCEICGEGRLGLDDIEEVYLAFLREPEGNCSE